MRHIGLSIGIFFPFKKKKKFILLKEISLVMAPYGSLLVTFSKEHFFQEVLVL